MKNGAFQANIILDDGPVPEYDENLTIQDGLPLTSCWIPSEVGKAFRLELRLLETQPYDINVDFYVDGLRLMGRCSRSGETSRVPLSPKTYRELIFSCLETTDDDHYSDSGRTKSIGEIEMHVWQTEIGKRRFSSLKVTPPIQGKVHERSKKSMLHCVGFGNEVRCEPGSIECYSCKNIRKLVIFIFKYRSRDVLQAHGILPCKPTAPEQVTHKRKAEDVEEHGESSSEEDKDNLLLSELKVLQEKMNSIQKQLEKKKSSRRISVKKIKKELNLSFNPGEVIDLT